MEDKPVDMTRIVNKLNEEYRRIWEIRDGYKIACAYWEPYIDQLMVGQVAPLTEDMRVFHEGMIAKVTGKVPPRIPSNSLVISESTAIAWHMWLQFIQDNPILLKCGLGDSDEKAENVIVISNGYWTVISKIRYRQLCNLIMFDSKKFDEEMKRIFSPPKVKVSQ